VTQNYTTPIKDGKIEQCVNRTQRQLRATLTIFQCNVSRMNTADSRVQYRVIYITTVAIFLFMGLWLRHCHFLALSAGLLATTLRVVRGESLSMAYTYDSLPVAGVAFAWPIMDTWRHPGNRKCEMSSKEDQAAATVNNVQKISWSLNVWFLDMRADRQTEKHRNTSHLYSAVLRQQLGLC